MEQLKQVVYDVVLSVARENEIEVEQLEADDKLVDGLGLTSLDLARIVAMLEFKLEVDPFARLVPITSVRTVGDLHEAYAKCFAPDMGESLALAPDVGESLALAPDVGESLAHHRTHQERRNDRAQRRKRRGEARRVL